MRSDPYRMADLPRRPSCHITTTITIPTHGILLQITPISSKMGSSVCSQLVSDFQRLQLTDTSAVHTLPTELLLVIFKGIPKYALPSVARVCRRWNSIAIPLLYHKMEAGSYSHTPEQVDALIKKVTSTTLKYDIFIPATSPTGFGDQTQLTPSPVNFQE